MNRRQMITGGVALSLFGGNAAMAQAMRPDFLPVEVAIRPDIAPNELHVLPDSFMLFWTMPGARAMRYMVGIGRPGLYESGEFFVGAKKEWPSWTPTNSMIERNPAYGEWKDGMPGGPNNPLGARALYLFEPGRGDTFLRIHGTNAPGTIGTAVSNGCARLVNDQAVDLYNRVPLKSRVVLHSQSV
ncbi:L,D-transpeptidase [Jannaschia donghaensis]|uniref:Putative L,D-transpeptidase ErfK/SrfK n=1 Tax=Jannaschia donghaensis TaxID=420998 RepID=A0A0M6YDZ6_9RHOB|nr:L,D-transpeptidase [Jannaschia donghaensis]CTQ48572.1 putative L,D-transpeptidase ErfK/SrfK precursor [Jannaschia donghaensis]